LQQRARWYLEGSIPKFRPVLCFLFLVLDQSFFGMGFVINEAVGVEEVVRVVKGNHDEVAQG